MWGIVWGDGLGGRTAVRVCFREPSLQGRAIEMRTPWERLNYLSATISRTCQQPQLGALLCGFASVGPGDMWSGEYTRAVRLRIELSMGQRPVRPLQTVTNAQNMNISMRSRLGYTPTSNIDMQDFGDFGVQ